MLGMANKRAQTLVTELRLMVILTRVISQVALAVIQIPAISPRVLIPAIGRPRTVIQIPATVLVDSLSKP